MIKRIKQALGALIEDGSLEEYNIEREGDLNIVGGIFKGTVKNIEPGLKAMFVDIGLEKNAFLHFWDAIPAALDSGLEEIQREGQKKKKKGFGGFIKAMKEGATAGGGSSTEKLKTEVLQPYLEKAFAKQKAYYATWIKKPENAKTKKHLDDVAALMKKAMKKYNDDIFNSPEYQRMLAFNKWYNNNKVMTAHNKTGRTIWVGSSKEAFMTTKISAGGSSSSVSCDKDMYYYYSDSKGSQGRKFYTKNSSCGGSVTIN